MNIISALQFFHEEFIVTWGDGEGIAYYGFLIAMAMLAGVTLAYFLSRRRGYPRDTALDIMIWCIPLAIVGARLYYVIFDAINGGVWAFRDIFQLKMAGLAIYGGVLAAILGCFLLSIYYKKKKRPDEKETKGKIDALTVKIDGLTNEMNGITGETDEDKQKVRQLNKQIKKCKAEKAGLTDSLIPKPSFLKMADLAAPFLILGQAIGRWGNYFNGEAYGPLIPDGSAWPQAFPLSVFIEGGADEGWHLATFFLESMWCLIGFGVMMFFLLRKKQLPMKGFIFAFYLMFYGAGRFVLEIFRTDSLWLVPDVIKVSMVVAAVMIVWGAVIMIRRKPDNEFDNKILINK